MTRLFRKIRYLLKRDRQSDELAEELEFHRSLLEQDGLTAGLDAAEAAQLARQKMGNETAAREESRAIWSLWTIDDLFRDLRYGLRMSARNVRSTALTVVALGIGIGLNAAVFIAYKAMIGQPLDARDPDEMVNIALIPESGAADQRFSYPDYLDYCNAARSFSGLIASRTERVTLSNAGASISQQASIAESSFGKLGIVRADVTNAEFARVDIVSENYFEVLGVATVQGPTFESIGSDASLAEPSVLISENYWERRFERDPQMLGRTIHLNGVPVRVIGITPRDFIGTDIGVPAFWAPIAIEPLLTANDEWLLDRENRQYSLRGRLASGVGIAEAQAEIGTINDRLRALHHPDSQWAQPAGALVWPGSPFPLPISMMGLHFLVAAIVGAALMVLGVSCANVASLQLARARSRQSELRARLCLGASRLRVIRQLVTESALVGVSAGGLALLCAWALLKELMAQYSAAVPVENGALVFDTTPDLGVIAAVFAVALAGGVLSGLAPALESTRSALAASMRDGATSLRSRRLQNVLVGAQVCLSLALLIGAGTLAHSAVRAIAAPTGYDAKQVLVLDYRFPERLNYSDARKIAVAHQLRERLAAQPGVAGISSGRAPDHPRPRTAAVAVHQEAPPEQAREEAQAQQAVLGFTFVEPNYFETLGVPLLLGPGFALQASASPSVVISQSTADKLWPNQNPVGRRLRLGPTEERLWRRDELVANGPTYEVVGVAADKRVLSFNAVGANEIYLPLQPDKLASRPILIRTQSEPSQLRRALEPLIRSVDPNIHATAATLDEMRWQTPPFLVSAMAAAVASTVGLCGLLLALMGIYGTVHYIVVLRTREVGVRMAIGAQQRDTIELILRESIRPVLAGTLLGMAVAIGGIQVFRRTLSGEYGLDILSLVIVSLLFLAVTLCASYPPARRATRIDPMVALRHE